METNKGVTIKELKNFLETLPKEFDSFGLVNGEVAGVGDYYARIDRPIIHLEVDTESGEMMMLHQSETELSDILKQINGDTK